MLMCYIPIMNENCDIPDKLEDLSKEELISLLREVKNNYGRKKIKLSDEKTQKRQSAFDFKRYKKRHVLLKFLYLGWDYAGFAVQVHTEETIEGHLFKALEKTKLIEARETSNYHRCGRTDKGVSAFSQVISLDLRSNLMDGAHIITPEDFHSSERRETTEELNYPLILNRILPPEIKIVAWAPVESGFSARFDCVNRTYKYWFPMANLNIERMQSAGQQLVGEHDFRNLCKMDVSNGVINYTRTILQVDVVPLHSNKVGEYDFAELTIKGQAFLWHQIRFIVSILFLIGQGKEDEKIIEQLLDVSTLPRKPQYNMASELPLVLFDTSYEGVQWIYDQECLESVVRNLQASWTRHAVKGCVLRRMLQELEPRLERGASHQLAPLTPGVTPREYRRLLDRPRCESLEERIQHFSQKKAKSNFDIIE